MTEETKPEQSYHYQTDQQVSVNAYFDTEVGGETVRFQITNRYGASTEKIVRTVKAAIEAYAALRAEFPRNIPAPEPKRVDIDDNGNDLPQVNTFTASRLSISVTDGKTSYRVHGGQFEKWGVSIYEEALKATGLDVSNPATPPNINGWRADWVEYTAGNGKQYKKITRLLPSKNPF